jgi:4,5-dihydroxyphthalate decarboxylase
VLTLTLACGSYDRTQPILDGQVPVEGCTIAGIVLPPDELFPRVFGQAPFDVTELSASSYILQVSRGEHARSKIVPPSPARPAPVVGCRS